MQFEVVLCLKGLLADLTLEPSSNAVSGKVTPEVSLTRKNLPGKEISLKYLSTDTSITYQRKIICAALLVMV